MIAGNKAASIRAECKIDNMKDLLCTPHPGVNKFSCKGRLRRSSSYHKSISFMKK